MILRKVFTYTLVHISDVRTWPYKKGKDQSFSYVIMLMSLCFYNVVMLCCLNWLHIFLDALIIDHENTKEIASVKEVLIFNHYSANIWAVYQCVEL